MNADEYERPIERVHGVDQVADRNGCSDTRETAKRIEQRRAKPCRVHRRRIGNDRPTEELLSNVVFVLIGAIRRQAVAEPVCCPSPVVRL